MATLSYSDVLDRYDRAKAFGETRSLPEYSSYMNDLFDTTDYSQGLRDGPWTRFSTRADQVIKGSPVGQAFGAVGAGVGSLFGHEDVGRTVGEGLPRALLQTAPAYLAGPEVGIPATLAMAGMFGAQTFADTGSAKDALISGVATALMPGLGKLGGDIGGKLLGGVVKSGIMPGLDAEGNVIGRMFPKTVVAPNDALQGSVKLGRFFGSQSAQAATNIASTVAQNRIAGGDMSVWDAASSPEFLLGQLPWTTYDAVHMAHSSPPTAEALDKVLIQPKTTPPPKPFESNIPKDEARNALVAASLQKALEIGKSDAAPEVKSQALTEMLSAMNDPAGVQAQKEAEVTQAQAETRTPVTIVGRGIKHDEHNSYRVLVESNDNVEHVGDLTGKTVWVNNIEPTLNEDGFHQFTTVADNIPESKYPLTEKDFGITPTTWAEGTEPQARQMTLDQQPVERAQHLQEVNAKPRLTSADVASMPEMGLNAQEAESVVKQTSQSSTDNLAKTEGLTPEQKVKFQQTLNTQQAETVQKIKKTILDHETAQHNEANAKDKLAKQPTTSAEIPTLLTDPVGAKEPLKTAVADGATATQAVSEAIQQQQTPEVDKAQVNQAVAKRQLKRIAQQDRVNEGNQLIEAFVNHATISQNPDDFGTQVGNIIKDWLKRSDETKKQNQTTQIAAIVAKWQHGDYGEITPQTLASALNGINRFAKLNASTTVLQYRDPNGNPTAFTTEEEVKAYITANNLESAGWKVEKKGKDRKNKFFVGKRPEAITSLDQPVGDGISTLGDFVADEPRDVPQNSKPTVSKKADLSVVTHLYSHSDDLAESIFGKNVNADREQIVKDKIATYLASEGLRSEGEHGAETEGFLAALNERLDSAGIDQVRSVEDLKSLREDVETWAKEFKTLRSKTMKSVVPGDMELGRKMGLFGTVHDLARYVAGQTQSMGFVANLMKAVLQSGILPEHVRIALPGSEGHTPEGWWMTAGIQIGGKDLVEPILNVPHFPPTDSNGIFQYVRDMAHELGHMSEVLYERKPDAHPEYKQTRTDVLGALRESKQVPKKVRDFLKQTIRDGDYGKWAESMDGEKSFDYGPKWQKGLGQYYRDYHGYVYSMQNESEMIAGLFSEPGLINIANQTGMPSKGLVDTALTFLSRMYNKYVLGGNGQNDALSELLRGYDRYLTSGILRKTYSGSDFIRDSLVAKGVMPDALASRMQTIDRTFSRGTLEASLTGFQREQANGLLHPMTAEGQIHPDVEAAIRTGKTGDVEDRTLDLLASDLPVHSDLARRMQQDVDITKSVLDEVKAGRIPGTVPPNLEENLKMSQAKLSAMHRALDKQGLAMERYNALNNFDPEGWETNVAQYMLGVKPSRLPDEVPDAAEHRKLVGMERLEKGNQVPELQKWFMLTPHLKEMTPSTKPVFNRVRSEQGDGRERLHMIHEAGIFNPDTQTVDKDIEKSNLRVGQSKALSEARDDILRWQNKENNMQLVDLKSPFVQKVLKRFNSDPDRTAILQAVKTIQAMHNHFWGQWAPDVMSRVNRENTGILLAAKEPGILPDQARQVSTDIYNGLSQLLDPTQAPLGAQLLQKVSTQLSPDAYLAALQHAQALSQATAQWIQKGQSNPGYVTEQRYGSDKLIMAGPKGERFATSGPTVEMRKQQATMAARGYSLLDYIKAGDVKNPNASISDDHIAALEQIQQRNVQAVTQAFQGDPRLQEVLSRMDMTGDLRAQLAAASPLPTVHRNFVEGREFINMGANADQFYSRMNNYFRVKSTRAGTALDMMHPEIKGNTELTNLLNDHVSNFLTPDNPIATKIVKSLYFYKLAFDMGQAMLWGTQNLTTGMSSLIGETGSVKDAFGYWGSAVKELSTHRVTGKWSSPEIQQLMDTASRRGQTGDVAGWNDFHDEQANTVYDTAAGPLAKAFSPIKNAARSLLTISSKVNDGVGLIAAFQLARERGMGFDDAYDFALDVKGRGHFNGGKAQRSVGLWNIQTKAVPQLLGALQTYSQGWFSQMAEQFQKGFGKAPEGLSDTQRVGAKKAFLYSIAAQAALAGVLGLPAVGQGIALLNQASGVDLKGWLRQNLAKIFDEDQTYGGWATSLALRGVGSAGLPFDPSSRASVSIPFLGVDSYKGFNPANLGGPVLSTAADAIDGMMEMLKGNPQGAEKVVPNALARPLTLLLGQGDIRDKRGALMTELSPSERFMMAVGLTPSRVQTQRDVSEAVKKANLDALKEKESFADTLAQEVRNGAVQDVQTQIQQYVQQHPQTSAKELISEVASRTEAQTFPFDPRREVQPGVDLSGFPSQYPGQEQARQALKQKVQSSLGMFPKTSSFNARSMFQDQAMTANPTLSRSSAARTSPSAKGLPVQSMPSPYSWLSSSATPAVFQQAGQN